MKHGVTAITTALLRLRAEGFQPDRDIIVLFTGDEENGGRGAETAANQWLDPSTLDFVLNADAGGGAYLADGRLLGFGIQTAEKIFQSFTFTATNPGGHSSRPRPDNAIYELAHSLDRLEHYRFEPHLNDTTRAYFRHRTETARPSSPLMINRWLANENDGAGGRLDRGHRTPRSASPAPAASRRGCAAAMPTMRFRSSPRRRSIAGCSRAPIRRPCSPPCAASARPDHVAVEPIAPAHPTDASPLRADVVGAYTAAVRARHPGAAITPDMSTGATDGLYFRARGVPVYGVDGSWAVIPADERAHGRDERLPVRAFYEDIDHWVDMIRRLAS